MESGHGAGDSDQHSGATDETGTMGNKYRRRLALFLCGGHSS